MMNTDVFEDLVPEDFPKNLIDEDAVKLMFRAGSNIIDP